jgi:hypothetical protein
MDVRVKTFAPEAAKRLNFLLDEYNFEGPQIERNEGASPLLIRVSYHRGDAAVETSLVLSYGGEEYVATELLRSRYASSAARRTEIGTDTAHTGYQMRRALDCQAAKLREVLRAPEQQTGTH